MYALHETGPAGGEMHRWICVYLLQRDRGYGWGYKDIEESMGPVEDECPVSYLDQADPATSQNAIEWRARVRRLAAERASKKPRVGQIWRLMKGCVVDQVRITSVRPLRGVAHGTIFKLKKRLLAEKMADERSA